MNIETIIMLATLIIYNAAIVKLLLYALSRIDVRQATAEKAAGAAQAGETSYSRVSGMIGAVVMAAFFWAVGNVVLYKAYTAPAEVSQLLTGIGTFIAGGASLFLPYAFNQLRETFAPVPRSGIASR